MKEYEKLKTRLANAGHQAQEYRMSMTEARSLLAEIERLIQGMPEPQQEQPQPVVVHEPVPRTRTIDGGSL